MFDKSRTRQSLKAFDFDRLFREELGWDNVDPVEIPVEVDNRRCTLTAIAQKHGFVAYHCQPDDGQGIPERQVCNKIDRQVTDYTREHLIIYSDAAQQEQYWQWVRREQGKPVAPRGERYRIGQDGERLIQKLDALFIDWDEEDSLTLSDVKKRAKKAFDVEKVTKKFYTEFKSQHGTFLGFITGIQDQFDQEWYASLMLNRLMFIYFIQQKGFLDGNRAYLQDRLKWCQAHRGEDEFQSFYRFFLLKLFHDGLGSSHRDADLDRLLGKIPYLNGGLFEVHQLEETYPDIQIPDSAFERIFDFFDQWDWHLDDRPHKSDREINPDVLGYIFEKYINQKQMGAYYTKEDITEYISKNTIIPYLFDAAKKGCKIAFEPGGSVWRLLQEDPDRYIYDAVKHGVIRPSSPNPFSHGEKGNRKRIDLPSPCGRGAGGEGGQIIPLPEDIAAGMDDVSQRSGWNRLADAEYGLPTEIWREHVARRQRCLEVREKLRNGEIYDINDLITYNLDIRQFAQDVIDTAEGPELLRAFYKAITTVSVLDPTCGSGAFLFAALNILQPLYDACLERMQGFVDDLDRAEEKPHSEKFKDFRETLAQVAKHPNRNYFIYKSIILNNLYGVDIMEEATEICKLRLFLKLVSQVEVNASAQNMGLEPLPDIDFNIRAGNTLVGFATLEEVRRAITQEEVKGKKEKGKGEEAAQFKLDLGDDLSRINEAAEIADRAYQLFRQMQTQEGMDGKAFAEAKQEVRRRLKALNEELNIYLAKEYSVDPNDAKAYQKWLKSHQPFHWLVEFYGIISKAGFDVIIGNPPYVETSKVKSIYQPLNFKTEGCGNLYAICTERSYVILRERGRFGFVVQQPVVSTQRMKILRDLLEDRSSIILASTYDDRPSKLFDGIHHARIAIIIASAKNRKQPSLELLVTPYKKWYRQERESLFEKIHYYLIAEQESRDVFLKIGSAIESRIVSKVFSFNSKNIESFITRESDHKIYYKITGVGHWFTITCRPPRFIRDQVESSSTRESSISFRSKEERDSIFCVLNSSLFYWLYQARTNCRDFNPSDYKSFPIAEKVISKELSQISESLQSQLDKSSQFISINHSKTGSIQVEQFRPREAKHLIDKIDKIIAFHYGFTDEELDFIINYDIKYRMGLDALEEDD